MREKLIDILEWYADFLDWERKEDIVDEIMKLFATDNNVGGKWIPVSERPPEDYQAVLCYKYDRGVRIGKHLNATYADGVAAFMDCGQKYAFGATHWMPLPEPPKER